MEEWRTHAIFDAEHIWKPRILCPETHVVRRLGGGQRRWVRVPCAISALRLFSGTSSETVESEW